MPRKAVPTQLSASIMTELVAIPAADFAFKQRFSDVIAVNLSA